ncbi:TRAP transporter small permease subunit [candidate division KSB3 bacterium]|uniref:TRAP transporter small permease subunit n=1 Tax=candidate division KSB3 bacterium TaxID=2044937 RepID=A0A9D5JS79_9BACT|nr:TRAP transporter small permease subunit [candidate division KSB3 bacterium]MBD3323228.1 TRAP transporter small permease subunit [candidate division KSB3 bacterium]
MSPQVAPCGMKVLPVSSQTCEVIMNLQRVTVIFDQISRYFAIVGGWAFLGLSVYIGIDVVGRKLFNLSLQGSDEIGGYVMAVTCAFGFSYTLAKRAHIRLNILLPRFPAAFQAIINLVAYAILTALAFMLVWRAAALLFETIELQAVAPTPLETPLWIPQSLWTLGLAWFFIQVTINLISAIILTVQTRISELNALFGVETVEEEASHAIEESI